MTLEEFIATVKSQCGFLTPEEQSMCTADFEAGLLPASTVGKILAFRKRQDQQYEYDDDDTPRPTSGGSMGF